MSAFSPKALRMIKAMEQYKINCQRWDVWVIFPRVTLKSASEGRITASFEVKEDICNVAKTLHGGFTSCVIDALSVYGMMHHHKRGCLPFTTDINVVYVNKAYIGDMVEVETKPIYVSKTRAAMECVMKEQKKGALIAKGIIGFILPDPPFLALDVFPYDPSKDE